jgi:predicted nucleic acid-binding Zn ribbon protein
MGKSQPKRQAHQAAKVASKKKRKVDWTRIALIIIGIMIVISMVLSMVRF